MEISRRQLRQRSQLRRQQRKDEGPSRLQTQRRAQPPSHSPLWAGAVGSDLAGPGITYPRLKEGVRRDGQRNDAHKLAKEEQQRSKSVQRRVDAGALAVPVAWRRWCLCLFLRALVAR